MKKMDEPDKNPVPGFFQSRIFKLFFFFFRLFLCQNLMNHLEVKNFYNPSFYNSSDLGIESYIFFFSF